MVDIEVFCIIFDCSPTTARRRIMEIHEKEGTLLPENNRISYSLLEKYKGVTKADVKFALEMHYKKLRESL